MRPDLSYDTLASCEVVERASLKRRVVETWRMEGSAGGQVLVDAHVPAAVDRVVVMAHGADNSRKARYIEVSGKSFARGGTAVVAMDAPRHGDRPDTRPLEDPVGTLLDVLEESGRDHRRLLDLVEARWPEVPVGFAGFSMGGLYGVAMAAVDERIRSLAVVIAGSTRVSYPERFGPLDAATEELLEVTDPAVHAPGLGERPVLVLAADEDEVVPRRSAIALYEAFPGPRELIFMPGTHTEWAHAARWFRRLESFFLETLR